MHGVHQSEASDAALTQERRGCCTLESVYEHLYERSRLWMHLKLGRGWVTWRYLGHSGQVHGENVEAAWEQRAKCHKGLSF